MSGIELKPVKSGGTNILLPLGKTNIGRGAFFSIGDKRVSRNHAVFEVEDGKVKIMPIHTNPTFFRREGGSKLVPLIKDKWQDLKNGDRIALTPDEHIFEIVIDERPIVQETQSPRHTLGDSSPLKLSSPQQNNGIHDARKENGQNDPISDGRQKENNDISTNAEGRSKSPIQEEKIDVKSEEEGRNGSSDAAADREHEEDATSKKEDEVKKVEEEEEEEEEKKTDVAVEEEKEDDHAGIQRTAAGTVVIDGGKEVALPVQRDRKLPSWMTAIQKADKEPAPAKVNKQQPPARAAPKEAKASDAAQKRGRGRPKGNSKSQSQVTRTPAKSRSRVRDDSEYDEDYSEEEPAPKRSKSSRSQRGTTKVASYAEDDYDDLDEEWVASDMDDDGSDWEMDSQSQSQKKGKGRKKTRNSPRGKASSPRKRGRPRKYTHTSEEDWSEEELYVPRPTKRRASSSSNSQPVAQTKRRGKQTYAEHDVSEEESEDEVVPQRNQRTNTNKGKKTDAKRKDHDVSDGDEEDDAATTQKKQTGKKKLKRCQFGKRCYRKNPVHFAEYCHPGDPDYDVNSEEDDDGDDRLECEYGTSCYRKSEEHKEIYKHTKPPGRPKREATKRGKKRGDDSNDDDDEPNTYDYNDSFIDDEDEMPSPRDNISDDSDWGPDQEDSQDVQDLMKEAKGFMRNKKMHKT
ncbi:uncharacterized protein [Diadema antillarum]|uniref:uncharacterized protein n=1 Tax=Diadema antillarum TaxID=105358 RepID=UPI003A85D6F6